MTMAKARVLPLITILALVGGIVAAVTPMWVPRLGGSLAYSPEPSAPFWEVPDSEYLTMTTSSASIAVLDLIASPRHVTVFYSIRVPNSDPPGQEATVSRKPTLVGSNGDALRAESTQKLASAQGVTLGAITFDPYRLGSRELSLRIPELNIGGPGSSKAFSLDEPIEIPILTRLRSQESSDRITRMRGVPMTTTGTIDRGPYGFFLGSSPQGQVATVSYNIDGIDRYFLVKLDGYVEESAEEHMAEIKDYLGITR